MRQCRQCDEPLVKKPGPGRWPHFCSVSCSRAAAKVGPVCAECGDRFVAGSGKTVLCPSCRGRWAASHRSYGPMTFTSVVACENCGETCKASTGGHRPVRFCSKPDCRRAAGRIRSREAYRERGPRRYAATCTVCAEVFEAQRRGKLYCSTTCSRRAAAIAKRESGKAADYSAKRRAREKGAKVKEGRRLAILERDNWTCQLCTLPVNRSAQYPAWDFPVIDHTIPLNRRGEHSASNWQTTHSYCNALKSDLSPSEFFAKYPDLRERVLAKAA